MSANKWMPTEATVSTVPPLGPMYDPACDPVNHPAHYTANNYILENSYVWSGNVPNDIDSELDYLE